jgi:hypothetical protein
LIERESATVLSEDAMLILKEHLKVGPDKPVSYLPLRTVEKVLGITASAYQAMIEEQGSRCVVFQQGETCIDSGAIYAYSEQDLESILRDNRDILVERGWPTAPADFVRRLASEWVAEDSPIKPIIRRVFGER